jgi:hypothetical protein
VGATAAEARRQLVLRTFASTSGDAARTSKVLGLPEAEVRAELLVLLNGAGEGARAATNDDAPAAPPARAARRQEPVAAPARSASKKPPARKGR